MAATALFFTGLALRSALVLLVAAVLALLLSRRSAAHRHAVWTAAIAAILALPLLGLVTPTIDVGVTGVFSGLEETARDGTGAWSTATGRQAVADADPGNIAVGAASGSSFAAGRTTPASGGEAAGTEVVTNSASGFGASAQLAAQTVEVRTAGPGVPWWLVAIGAWAIGAVLLLGRLGVGLTRLRGLARRARPVTSDNLGRAARRAAARVGLKRVPSLAADVDSAMPVTWGVLRPIVLLPESAAEWSEHRIEAVLMHEFSHVARRDYAIQVAAEFVCALYWFNPLTWLAARRLRVERELASDDLVVAAGFEPAGYADELLQLARSLRAQPAPRSFAVAMGRKAGFRERLVALLDESRDRRPISRLRGTTIAALMIGTAVLAAAVAPTPAEGQDRAAPPPVATPANPDSPESPVAESAEAESAEEPSPPAEAPPVEAPPTMETGTGAMPAPPEHAFLDGELVTEIDALCGPADGEMQRRSHHTDDGETTVETEYGRCRSKVEIRGAIEFTDTYDGIRRVGPGGFLSMSVDRPSERRRLEARPGEGGQPAYRWWVDGNERSFDASAAAWLEEALVDLFRNSGYRARERAAWILAERGFAGVMAEVELIRSQHVGSIYLTMLAERGDLSQEQQREILRSGADLIASDHSLANLLQAFAENQSFDAATTRSFLLAARTVDSDHSRGKVYRAFLEREDATPQEIAVILKATEEIGSDHERAKLLVDLAERGLPGSLMQRAYLEAAASIGSDHSLARTLGAFIEHARADVDERNELLRTARNIGSDHALSNVLLEFVSRYGAGSEVRTELDRTLETVGSSHSRENVERAMRDARQG